MSANPYPMEHRWGETNDSAHSVILPIPMRSRPPAEVHPPIPLHPNPNGVPPIPQGSDQDLWVTDELLFDYQRCNRRAFLDVYGDNERRDPPSDYLKKLRQDSVTHQLDVLGEGQVHRPHYPSKDWQAGAIATLELMQQGVERITKGVVVIQHEPGIWLVSCPNLLVKQAGVSAFGDWYYVPVDVRLGKRPKLDYQITAAFHAYVLAQVQNAWSAESWLMLRQRGAYAVYVAELLPRMRDILNECVDMLRLQQEPEVFIAHNRCDLCHWFSHCYELAQQDDHLSLLPGVTPNRYHYLRNLDLLTLEALTQTNPRSLEYLPGFGSPVAHRLVQQARATLANRALPRPLLPEEAPRPLLHPQELPTAPVELYFDIEAAPEQNLVYLHGVLLVDRHAQSETFYPFLADDPKDEAAVWEEFLDLVTQFPEAPVYHFCPFEVQTVRRLGQKFNSPDAVIEALLERFVDLHERVTRTAVLPVESYALKAIARWMGFSWRDADANGAQSIFWYAEWRRTGDRTYLDTILRYNEDDCRATYHVKDWLIQFLEENPYPAFGVPEKG